MTNFTKHILALIGMLAVMICVSIINSFAYDIIMMGFAGWFLGSKLRAYCHSKWPLEDEL